MIIVVPVSKTDCEVVDDFIKVFNLFGPYENHDLVVVNRPADIKEGRRVLEALAHNNFKRKTHWTFDEDGRCGWPGGPNHYWVETINFLAEEYEGDRQQPWLWLEMDMTPLKHGWLDTLQEEYEKCDKPFMGNLAWTTTTTTEDDNSHKMLNLCQHLVGAAIYPPASEMDKYSKLWRKVNKINTAWDVILQWELPQHAHDTKLIQMLFRTGNYKKFKNARGKYIIQGEDREPWPDPNYTFSKPVNIENVVLVHGCNDGSLARLIYEEETGEKIIDKKDIGEEIIYGAVCKDSKRKLPVFFHVPKCAGTYTYNIIFRAIRKYISNKRELLNVVVKSGEFIKYRVACTTKRPLTNKYKQLAQAKWAFSVDYNDLVIDDLDVYFVEVCSSSFSDYKDYIYKNLPDNVEPYELIFLREPYDRTLSLYNYLISSQSSHEPTGGKLNAKSFIDYLNSNQLQGSWLIHALLNIPDSKVISHYNYRKVCGILDDMIVSDISDVDNTILKVLEVCYNLTISVDDLKACRKIYANKTINTIDHPYETLDIDTQSHFKSHTKWDYKLYNKYIQ